MGIYITNAVKTPKTEYAIDKSSIEKSLPYLEEELALFPNIKVIMLMGDVEKKAFNMITKKATKKNAIPAVSTYKLRSSEIYYEGIRVMPSYIMTGGNILIEKSKVTMATEDIATIIEAQSLVFPRPKRSRCRSSQGINDTPTPFSASNYCLPALPIASMSLS